jgi:hypothetical protein
MNNFHLSPLTKLSLSLLLLVASFFMVPAPALAVCCGWETDIDYYADSAKTQYVGSCYTDCNGFTSCTGSTGPYWTRTRTCCGPCLP